MRLLATMLLRLRPQRSCACKPAALTFVAGNGALATTLDVSHSSRCRRRRENVWR